MGASWSKKAETGQNGKLLFFLHGGLSLIFGLAQQKN
jgi:hypothetical protein